MRIASVLALTVLLSACAAQKTQQLEQGREVAARTAARVLFDQRPAGYPVTQVSKCVSESATEEELVKLLEAEVQGITGRTTQLVLSMVQRPEVQDCARASGVLAGL